MRAERWLWRIMLFLVPFTTLVQIVWLAKHHAPPSLFVAVGWSTGAQIKVFNRWSRETVA